MNTIQVTDQHMFWLLVSEVRNGIQRDNHLAPFTAVDMVKEYLPQMSPTYAKLATEMIYKEIRFAQEHLTLEFGYAFDELFDFLKPYFD